jgi:hypothetical protein
MKKQYSLSLMLSSLLVVLSGCGGTADTSKSDILPNDSAKIEVSLVNKAPVATFETFSINRGVTYNGQLTAIDQDNDALEYELVSDCKHGKITVDKNGCFTYIPDAGYKGDDSFSYRVKDDVSACPTKTVTINVTEKPITLPVAPSNLKLEALSTCKIKITWDDNADNETGFEIFRDGELVSVEKENITTTNICGNMSPATTYEIEVRAKNAAGSSVGVKGSVTTKDITTPPKAPSDLKVLAFDKNSARLAWKDNADNESAYDIYQDGKLIKTIETNCNCTIVSGLESGRSYEFQVIARNKIGDAESNTITVTTESEPIVVVPNEAPVVTLIGKSSEVVVFGDIYNDAGATASDAEDGDLNATCISNVDTNQVGEYAVVCHAVDSAGQRVEVTRSVSVIYASDLHTKSKIPYDSNLELGGEEGILYYVDPRPEENGLNRALRIDYLNWSYTDLNVSGVNPHSLDRAGDSDKFYVRTQNSNSFDVVNFKEKSVKTVDMKEHKPRAIGATNLKYNLQLISVRNRQVVDVIDTTTDTIIASLGDETETPGITTGHALWFDEDYFGLVDRAAPQIVVYKVVDTAGELSFVETDRIATTTSLHAIERVAHPKTRADLVTFYGNGEGDIAKGGNITPFIEEYIFNPENGTLTPQRSASLSQSTATVHGRPPISHHSGISPDGKYFYAPVFDGKVYIIDRATMQVVKVLEAALGAAHVEFSASLGLAIITNHWSNEVTIIDLATQSVKKRLIISTTQTFHEEEPHLLQPHFSYLSNDGKYFYTLATQDGDFLRINLETLEVEEKLHVGGAPEQAHS